MSKQYGGFSQKQRNKLLEESLDLIVTYYGQDAGIFVHTSERSLNYQEPVHESLQYFRNRFILAKWVEFKDILGSIESLITSGYEPVKEEFTGRIQGTLLISEYVTKKYNNVLEKKYPCLVSYEDLNTPENAFLFRLVKSIHSQIRLLPLPNNSAEFSLQQKALLDCSNMLQHPAFQVVKKGTFYSMKMNLLLSLLKTRNRRLQTGNVKKFSQLIQWYNSLSWASLISKGPEKLELVFGHNPNTWDKFFEVWVLSKLLESLEKEGTVRGETLTVNIETLEKRLAGPVAIIKTSNFEINVYFQNSTLLNGQWKYNSGGALRGIPDILLVIKRSSFNTVIILDVKNVYYQSRKDGNTEKYKMLGYFENYRGSFSHSPIGILILRNDHCYCTDSLETEDDAKLSLHTVSPENSLWGFEPMAQEIWDWAIEPQKGVEVATPLSNPQVLINKALAAHAKASELAEKKPEELLRCKNELKRYVFPTTWEYFPEECRTLLGMAELLYQNLQEQCGLDPDVDWGPAVLEYCRAVEYFFNHEIIIPFKISKHFLQAVKSKSSPGWPGYLHISERDTLMFGELARFFKKLRNSSGGIFAFLQDNKHFNRNQGFWKQSLSDVLSVVNKNYRRKAAHIDLLGLRDVQECRSIIIGSAEKKGLLPSLFDIKA